VDEERVQGALQSADPAALGQVGQVNLQPDGADDEGDEVGDAELAQEPPDIRHSWTPRALPLGLCCVVISVLSLILLLQGVFQWMPS
jgi:hypothetical protein